MRWYTYSWSFDASPSKKDGIPVAWRAKFGRPSLAHRRNLVLDVRALSALVVRGVEHGITRTCSGVYKAHILVLTCLSWAQQTRSFSTKQKIQQTHPPQDCCKKSIQNLFVGSLVSFIEILAEVN